MIEALFTSRARIELLSLLILGKDDKYYLRELSTLTNLPIRSVQREMANLTEAGITLREISGRQTYYSINKRCPIIPELRMMLIKTVGIGDALRETLMPEKDSIDIVFIFGSFATGRLTVESDVDIFIIGNITLRRIGSLLKSIDISREINPVIVPKEEFRERIDSGNHFFTSILDTPKIFLIGDEDELTELAGLGRPDRTADFQK